MTHAITFPAVPGQNPPRYSTHCAYAHAAFKAAGARMDYAVLIPPDHYSFLARVNGKPIPFDFANGQNVRLAGPHFKYQCVDIGGDAIPFAKVSFHDWAEVFKAIRTIRYAANTDRILNNQRVRYARVANARRLAVQPNLRARYGADVDFALTTPAEWWSKFADCLVYVHVP
ncbi:MAG: hypothetical protein AAB368_06150, partial [bacterium]